MLLNELSIIWGKIGRKSYIHACVCCVFKALKIQNGHCLNVQMKRARNSDYKTHVKSKIRRLEQK